LWSIGFAIGSTPPDAGGSKNDPKQGKKRENRRTPPCFQRKPIEGPHRRPPASGRHSSSPSAEDRLPKSLHFAESDVIIDVVRARSVHKVGNGHKRETLRQGKNENRGMPRVSKESSPCFLPVSSLLFAFEEII
jgi:hypothetical protein